MESILERLAIEKRSQSGGLSQPDTKALEEADPKKIERVVKSPEELIYDRRNNTLLAFDRQLKLSNKESIFNRLSLTLAEIIFATAGNEEHTILAYPEREKLMKWAEELYQIYYCCNGIKPNFGLTDTEDKAMGLKLIACVRTLLIQDQKIDRQGAERYIPTRFYDINPEYYLDEFWNEFLAMYNNPDIKHQNTGRSFGNYIDDYKASLSEALFNLKKNIIAFEESKGGKYLESLENSYIGESADDSAGDSSVQVTVAQQTRELQQSLPEELDITAVEVVENPLSEFIEPPSDTLTFQIDLTPAQITNFGSQLRENEALIVEVEQLRIDNKRLKDLSLALYAQMRADAPDSDISLSDYDLETIQIYLGYEMLKVTGTNLNEEAKIIETPEIKAIQDYLTKTEFLQKNAQDILTALRKDKQTHENPEYSQEYLEKLNNPVLTEISEALLTLVINQVQSETRIRLIAVGRKEKYSDFTLDQFLREILAGLQNQNPEKAEKLKSLFPLERDGINIGDSNKLRLAVQDIIKISWPERIDTAYNSLKYNYTRGMSTKDIMDFIERNKWLKPVTPQI